jgi:NtrC-family two-component system sensor histidine kinase KinB
MNRIARQVLRVDGDATGGESSRELRLDDLPLPPAVIEAIREALDGNPPTPPRADLTNVVLATVDGHAVKLLPVAIPVPHYRDGAHGAVAVLYDVTEFAKLDELRMELIAVASHELKTPLTTLRMNLLLMEERSADFDDRQREFLLNSIDGCDELGKTIDELLDLTRADAGQLKLSLERVDVGVVAEDAVRSLRPRFEEAGIALTVEKRGEHAICRGDPLRLGMVLTNVLTNALKYTPAAGRVGVTVVSMQNAGQEAAGRVQIAVTDTGPGVPEEFRARVFEKFFRVEHHRPNDAKQVRGTGIGLYLCRHIIQAHEGEIWCEAGEDNSGTRIVMEIPAECQAARRQS